MRENRSDGVPPPAAAPPRKPVVLAVPPGPPTCVVLASPCLYGVCLHWDGRRSRYCPGPDGGCTLCPRLPRLWYGYSMCVERDSDAIRIAEVTHAAYQHCPALPDCEGRLVGMVAEFSRLGKGRNTGLKVRLHPNSRYVLPSGIPNIRVCLGRLLGVDLP